MKRVRGNAPNLVEGNRFADGIKISQSGHWDDRLLCQQHENALAPIDDYIARFLRRVDQQRSAQDPTKTIDVANPRPDLLLLFVYSIVWKYVNSHHGRSLDLRLGHYEKHITNSLFFHETPNLEVLIALNNIKDKRGTPIEIAITPYRRKMLDLNVWHFTAGKLDFFLKTDQRQFPNWIRDFFEISQNPLPLLNADSIQFDTIPMFQPIFRRMLSPRLSSF